MTKITRTSIKITDAGDASFVQHFGSTNTCFSATCQPIITVAQESVVSHAVNSEHFVSVISFDIGPCAWIGNVHRSKRLLNALRLLVERPVVIQKLSWVCMDFNLISSRPSNLTTFKKLSGLGILVSQQLMTQLHVRPFAIFAGDGPSSGVLVGTQKSFNRPVTFKLVCKH